MKKVLFFLFPLVLFSADMNETLTSDYNATLNANQLGMAYSDYNFSMALAGSLIGLIFLAGLVYLSISIGKGR